MSSQTPMTVLLVPVKLSALTKVHFESALWRVEGLIEVCVI